MKSGIEGEKLPPDLWFPFYGGLGDILLRCYQTRFWYTLENATERVGVVVASVNPYATELFRWHINRENIVLFDLAHMLEHYSGQGIRGGDLHREMANFAGLDWPGKYENYRASPPQGWRPTFFAPDYLDDSGYIVFHPFAGLKSRSLSRESLSEILHVLGKVGCNVYIPSRDFLRFSKGRSLHEPESLPDIEIPDNIVLLKNLSVPATLNLVRNSQAFVGVQSSLILAAALEGVPSLALYPEYLREEFAAKRGYAFYDAYDHVTSLPFSEVSGQRIIEWFDVGFDADTFEPAGEEKARVDRLARWVIDRGGGVNVDWHCPPDYAGKLGAGQVRNTEIRTLEELPEGRFCLWRFNFAGCTDFDDSALLEMRSLGQGIKTLTNLNISGTSVTIAGLKHLAWLEPSLRFLDPGSHMNRTALEKKMAKILPGCHLV